LGKQQFQTVGIGQRNGLRVDGIGTITHADAGDIHTLRDTDIPPRIWRCGQTLRVVQQEVKGLCIRTCMSLHLDGGIKVEILNNNFEDIRYAVAITTERGPKLDASETGVTGIAGPLYTVVPQVAHVYVIMRGPDACPIAGADGNMADVICTRIGH
jgi:hypothetical protein